MSQEINTALQLATHQAAARALTPVEAFLALPLAELRRVEIEDYRAAFAAGVITLLKTLVLRHGTPDGPNAAQVVTLQGQHQVIVLTLAKDNALTVQVGAHLVCDDRQPGGERYVPGRWVIACLEYLRDAETAQAAQAAREIETAKLTLAQHLSANV